MEAVSKLVKRLPRERKKRFHMGRSFYSVMKKIRERGKRRRYRRMRLSKSSLLLRIEFKLKVDKRKFTW